MSKQAVYVTGVERFFDKDEIIVSKTDLKGRITYSNHVFMRVGLYDEKQLLGTPHNILRHPDMPRCIFKLLWDTVTAGNEIFAYVLNRARNGDHYWVFAHVTPSIGPDGSIIGYHSNRRVPERHAVERIMPIYRTLLAEEARHADSKVGMTAALGVLSDMLKQNGVGYDEFVFSL